MHRSLMAVALTGLTIALGCSGSDANRPETAKAGGQVTLDGQPVADASVSLSPDGPGRAAFGKTDAQGMFTLATTPTIEGVVPGTYRVSVVKQRTEGGMTEAESQAYYETTGQPPPPPRVTDELPEKYKAPATSELQVTVTAEGPNDFKFDLKK
jgi:hypothetical protein